MTQSDGSASLSPLAQDILAYLETHPGARDSLEGIVEWWLLERNIARGLFDIKQELETLVNRGLVEKLQGGTQYRRKPRG